MGYNGAGAAGPMPSLLCYTLIVSCDCRVVLENHPIDKAISHAGNLIP